MAGKSSGGGKSSGFAKDRGSKEERSETKVFMKTGKMPKGENTREERAEMPKRPMLKKVK